MARIVGESEGEVLKRYFDWLLNKIDYKLNTGGGYDRLLNRLNNTRYIWTLEMDENRAEDGIALRERFCNESRIFGFHMDENEYPCTVLEMLVALAIRCEGDIMGEPGEENPGKWFWIMMENLGLDGVTDRHFDPDYVDDILDIWMSNEFQPDGTGGLFPLISPTFDQRNREIWTQMGNYLEENFEIND